MFIGKHAHTLDDKNRVTVPSRFREVAEKEGSTLILTLGLDKCLFGFTASQWERTLNRVNERSFEVGGGRPFQRLMMANANPCDLDKQGRILIPENLKRAAGIERDVTMVGVGDRMEIWGKAAWEQYETTWQTHYEESAENLFRVPKPGPAPA